MVITVVSKYKENPPLNADAPRKITTGPLYSKSEILELLDKDQRIQVWTRKSKTDMQNLAMDENDLRDLIRLAIAVGEYRCSEWCVQKPAGPWAACDVYTVKRKEWMPAAQKDILTEYYIKYAIALSGTVLLLVSFHLTEH